MYYVHGPDWPLQFELLPSRSETSAPAPSTAARSSFNSNSCFRSETTTQTVVLCLANLPSIRTPNFTGVKPSQRCPWCSRRCSFNSNSYLGRSETVQQGLLVPQAPPFNANPCFHRSETAAVMKQGNHNLIPSIQTPARTGVKLGKVPRLTVFPQNLQFRLLLAQE